VGRGLALASGIEQGRPPGDATPLRAGLACASRLLLVLDDAADPVLRNDGERWLGALVDLEARWWGPLAGWLRRGGLTRLQIHDCAGHQWWVQRAHLRRFWRRRRPLAALRPVTSEHHS
jgi:hypothetical protein